MASMTLVELTARNTRMKTMKRTAIAMWVRLRNRSSSARSKKSTHTLVVNAVSALSALEKLAATMPMVKSMTTVVPSCPEAANIGSRSSPICGNAMPRAEASHTRRMPSTRNNRFTGTKAKP